MIGLLVDAAIAAVTILDRFCTAVEAARPQNPPSGVGVLSPRPVGAASAGTGGHPEPWVFPRKD